VVAVAGGIHWWDSRPPTAEDLRQQARVLRSYQHEMAGDAIQMWASCQALYVVDVAAGKDCFDRLNEGAAAFGRRTHELEDRIKALEARADELRRAEAAQQAGK